MEPTKFPTLCQDEEATDVVLTTRLINFCIAAGIGRPCSHPSIVRRDLSIIAPRSLRESPRNRRSRLRSDPVSFALAFCLPSLLRLCELPIRNTNLSIRNLRSFVNSHGLSDLESPRLSSQRSPDTRTGKLRQSIHAATTAPPLSEPVIPHSSTPGSVDTCAMRVFPTSMSL